MWWWWWWIGHGARPAAYTSNRGLAAGAYRYQSQRGLHVAAIPLPPTPNVVYVRSRDKNLPLVLDFERELGTTDTVSSAAVAVLAQPVEQQGVTPTDVTSTLLQSQDVAGTQVHVTLLNANAVPDTEYTVRVVATMQSGLVLQEQIGGGPQSRLYCDQ